MPNPKADEVTETTYSIHINYDLTYTITERSLEIQNLTPDGLKHWCKLASVILGQRVEMREQIVSTRRECFGVYVDGEDRQDG